MCARAALITAASSVISTIASTVIFARRMGSGPPARRDPGAAGAGGRGPDGRPADQVPRRRSATAVAGVVHQAERQETIRQSRVDMIRQYARTEACRGGYLAAYFGQRLSGRCGHCDNCAAGLSGQQPTDRAEYLLHSTVHHREWARGTVMSTSRTGSPYSSTRWVTGPWPWLRSGSTICLPADVAGRPPAAVGWATTPTGRCP
jgi:hypothetical protein